MFAYFLHKTVFCIKFLWIYCEDQMKCEDQIYCEDQMKQLFVANYLETMDHKYYLNSSDF